jgi:dephospho-CoA kinase
VGGIGSGKSLVARTWAKRHGAAVIDGDAVGHEALKDEQIARAIFERFGRGVQAVGGQVDRRALAALVFGAGAAQRQARAALESIVHPWIAERLRGQVAAARREPGTPAIVLDAAVLLEAGWRRFCQLVVFVDCPFAERARRVAQSREWSEQELRMREESQWPMERKRAEADVVITNEGDLEQAVEQLDRALKPLIAAPHSDT